MSERPLFDHLPERSPNPRSSTAPDGRRPASTSDFGADPSDGVETHLLDYVRVLYKRRATALTVFVLVVGATIARTFTATPVYEATTRLLIEAEQQNVVNFKPVVEEDQTKADYYQTQYNVLKSRALARRTLDELHLWATPPFGGQRTGAKTDVSEGDLEATQPAIDTFEANLEIAPVRNSRLVDVKFRLPDPELATRIVNALAKNYIDQSLEYRFTASREANDWLGARLAEQRKDVEAAEANLQKYREQHDAIALADHDNIIVQKLADLNATVTRAKTDRLIKEATYKQLQAFQADPLQLSTAPAILANPFIQQQKSELASLQQQAEQAAGKLGPKHPEMIKLTSAIRLAQAKLETEVEKVVQSVRNEYQTAQSHEASLTTALDQQKGEALAMNRKAIEYSVLERDVESSTQLYNSLLQRAKETGITGELKTSSIRVVDPAERPRRPVSPNKTTNLLLALLGGSFLAGALAFFLEYIDSRIKSPQELETYLGLGNLGLLPVLSETDGHYPLLNNGVPANFAEAFRTLRTNVLFSTAKDGPRFLVVTSTGPREGKSMVSSNLAISLAQTGQRTLLVDADMRRPKVHDLFQFPQEPGLSNVMVGDAQPGQAVQQTPVPGLCVLAAGRIPPNPTELLGSERFRELMASLKPLFDWIVIDTPPVMAVADAALVAHDATGVVFVVGADMTSRYAARRALEQLQRADAVLMGAVLNKVDLAHNAYYYSQYYRREYTQYYTSPV